MRPIKVTYNYSINSTAYVAECTYHNVSEKCNVIICKKADEEIPTNAVELMRACNDKRISDGTVLSKEYMEQTIIEHDQGSSNIEVYAWKL